MSLGRVGSLLARSLVAPANGARSSSDIVLRSTASIPNKKPPSQNQEAHNQWRSPASKIALVPSPQRRPVVYRVDHSGRTLYVVFTQTSRLPTSDII